MSYECVYVTGTQRLSLFLALPFLEQHVKIRVTIVPTIKFMENSF